ncbi:GNAT family N-acetyltransferase [Dongia sedimenti]|uniref:GNAT family N-acetyltransferase n=1 Tax=Dongia sedimenti TaxID=3064282 RepID=A0ABU0YV72_9PROT|nr:GNAT family N-acetyltransferase [Rhodospirillaceae bacterium R-7]
MRPTGAEDGEAFGRIADDALLEFNPRMPTPFDAQAWIAERLEHGAPRIGHTVMRKADSAVIGYVQVEPTPVSAKEVYNDVGYWFGRAFWGHGFATEAVLALLAYLDQPGAWPAFANVDLRNTKSMRVLERAGFTRRDHGPTQGRDGFVWYRWLARKPAVVSF